MAEALRIKGQEIQIRVVSGGNLVTSLSSIASFNDGLVLELKSDGFLGEPADRNDEVFSGYKGDFEFQPNSSDWYDFTEQVRRRATREDPSLVFNIIKTEFYSNGQTAIVTYMDVKWGAIPTSTAGRKEYSKTKFDWACSERSLQINNLV